MASTGRRWTPYINWVWFSVTGAGFPSDPYPAFADHAPRHEARPAVQRGLAREAIGQQELEAWGLTLAFKPVDEIDENDGTTALFRGKPEGASR